MNSTPLYQIVDWDKKFENFGSRVVDHCKFVCMSNDHGCIGLVNLLSEPDGSAIYGGWALLVQLCSRQPKPRNGYLTADGKKDGRRLTAAELSLLFQIPVARIQRCLQVLSLEKVKFIQLLDGQPEHTQTMLGRCPARWSNDARRNGRMMLGDDDERKKEVLSNARVRAREAEQKENKKDIVQYPEVKQIFGKLSEEVFEPASSGAGGTSAANDVDTVASKASANRAGASSCHSKIRDL